MKIGFGVSAGIETLKDGELEILGVCDDALLVLFELGLVGVGAGSGVATVVVTS